MYDLSPEERLNLIAKKVEDHLHLSAAKNSHPQHNPEYRMQHTLRVAHYGKTIAEEENAQIELVIAACLLHDIAHFESEDDYKNHGRLGAKISRPILENAGYSAEEIEQICYSIAVHVDGDAGYYHPEILEAKIVSDADNIDRFGAYRVIQWCTVDVQSYEDLIFKLQKRVRKLKEYQKRNPLETKAGRRIFETQLLLQIDFFNKILSEAEITRIPVLS